MRRTPLLPTLVVAGLLAAGAGHAHEARVEIVGARFTPARVAVGERAVLRVEVRNVGDARAPVLRLEIRRAGEVVSSLRFRGRHRLAAGATVVREKRLPRRETREAGRRCYALAFRPPRRGHVHLPEEPVEVCLDIGEDGMVTADAGGAEGADGAAGDGGRADGGRDDGSEAGGVPPVVSIPWTSDLPGSPLPEGIGLPDRNRPDLAEVLPVGPYPRVVRASFVRPDPEGARLLALAFAPDGDADSRRAILEIVDDGGPYDGRVLATLTVPPLARGTRAREFTAELDPAVVFGRCAVLRWRGTERPLRRICAPEVEFWLFLRSFEIFVVENGDLTGAVDMDIRVDFVMSDPYRQEIWRWEQLVADAHRYRLVEPDDDPADSMRWNDARRQWESLRGTPGRGPIPSVRPGESWLVCATFTDPDDFPGQDDSASECTELDPAELKEVAAGTAFMVVRGEAVSRSTFEGDLRVYYWIGIDAFPRRFVR